MVRPMGRLKARLLTIILRNLPSDLRRHLEPAAVLAGEELVGLGVVGNDSVAASKVSLRPTPVGDVAEVAEPGAEVADLDVGVGRRRGS